MGFVRSVSPMLVLGVWNLGVGRTGVCRVGDRKPVPPHATFFRFPGCSMGPFGPPTAAPTTSSSSVSPHLCTCTCILGLGRVFVAHVGVFRECLVVATVADSDLLLCPVSKKRRATPLYFLCCRLSFSLLLHHHHQHTRARVRGSRGDGGHQHVVGDVVHGSP